MSLELTDCLYVYAGSSNKVRAFLQQQFLLHAVMEPYHTDIPITQLHQTHSINLQGCHS